MYIRKLELHDAPLMLEWMHDPEISCFFRANFASMTLNDAEKFIASSAKLTLDNCINLAVSSDDNEYMGTVSLKDIDFAEGSAEFAIVMRKKAMGHGFSWFGMRWIIEKAFSELNLSLIYWNVLRNNFRAVRFYDKHNFSEMLNVPEKFAQSYQGLHNLKWYSIGRHEAIIKLLSPSMTGNDSLTLSDFLNVHIM